MDSMLEGILDLVQVGIAVYDDNYQLMLWNKWMSRLTEMQIDEASKKAFNEIHPVFQKTTYALRAKQTLEEGKSWFFSSSMKAKYITLGATDEERKFNMQMDAIELNGKRCMVIQVFDQTAQYQRVKQLKEALQLLEANLILTPHTAIELEDTTSLIPQLRTLMQEAKQAQTKLFGVTIMARHDSDVSGLSDEEVVHLTDAINLELLKRLRYMIPAQYPLIPYQSGVLLMMDSPKTFDDFIKDLMQLYDRMDFTYYVGSNQYSVKPKLYIIAYPDDVRHPEDWRRLINAYMQSNQTEDIIFENPMLHGHFIQTLNLQRTTSQLQMLYEHINQGIMFAQIIYRPEIQHYDAVVLSANSRIKSFLKISDPIQSETIYVSDVLRSLNSYDEAYIHANIDHLLTKRKAIVISEFFIEVLQMWFRIDLYPMPNQQFSLIMSDITESKLYQLKIEQLAYFDTLTGVPNRKMFFEQASRMLSYAKRHNHQFALLYIDFDKFKLINDSLGHEVGDEVLKRGADILKAAIRTTDLIARIGGDEFIIVMQDVTVPEDVRTVVNRMLSTFDIQYPYAGSVIRVGISVGVALYPAHGDSLEMLLHQADLAMYRAKSCPDNRFLFSDEQCEVVN